MRADEGLVAASQKEELVQSFKQTYEQVASDLPLS
jgi:hypothetical protein